MSGVEFRALGGGGGNLMVSAHRPGSPDGALGYGPAAVGSRPIPALTSTVGCQAPGSRQGEWVREAGLGWPRRHQRRAPRRLHPCQVLAKLSERPDEERLEMYRVRWRVFDYAVESHRAELGPRVDALAEAEHRLLHLGAGQLRPEERAARLVELAERAVIRY